MSHTPLSSQQLLRRIEAMAESGPYSLAAYDFVLRGLDHTIRSLPQVRHVSGRELVHGIERFAKNEYGPLAKHVLNTWGLTRTRDFGEIVFQLVEAGILRKTAEDSIDDFVECFDFDEVFERDYYKDHPVFQD